jgi:septum formation protein
LLRAAGIDSVADPPGIDEDRVGAEDPVERALILARAKLEAVLPRHPQALVIAADQVAHLNGKPFGKPAHPAGHLEMLRGLVGKEHELVTGVALGWGEVRREFTETTRILFRSDITEDELRRYVAQGEGAMCAGGYRVESLGPWFIEQIEGDWFNVVGLPIPRLITELRALGFRLPLAEGPGNG